MWVIISLVFLMGMAGLLLRFNVELKCKFLSKDVMVCFVMIVFLGKVSFMRLKSCLLVFWVSIVLIFKVFSVL